MNPNDDVQVQLDRATLSLGKRVAQTDVGPFEVHFFRDQSRDASVMAIVRGDLSGPEPLLARVHSSCATSECLMARDCDCVDQLAGTLARIAEAGRGVVFYLIQEGRGAGLTAKARDRMMVQASDHRMTTFEAYAEMGLPSDLRRYDVLAPIVRALGIESPIELLSNNPDKVSAVSAVLAEIKIDVEPGRPIEGGTSLFNRDYLRAKRRSGHVLSEFSDARGALPPETVRVEPALRSRAFPHLISTARYQLPVDLRAPVEGRLGRAATAGVEDVDWFPIRIIYDERNAKESILLGVSNGGDDVPIVCTLGLMDRLPCAEATGRETLRRALIQIRDAGQGRVLVLLDEASPYSDVSISSVVKDFQAEVAAATWESEGDRVSPASLWPNG